MSNAPRSLKDYLAEYLNQFRLPAHELDMSFARWIIFGFFIYKLLSRDFTTFAYMPDFLMNSYPAYIFGPNFYALMGTQFFTDLASFHWIHWFITLPDASTLFVLQWLTITLCALTCVFGRGPHNSLAIITYVFVSYMWGYMWRTCNEVDAVFLALGCMLVYCFTMHREHLTLWRPGFGAKASAEAGWAMQGFLMVFVIYYFASGMNKIIDITLIDWFRFDLVQITEYERDRYILGYYKDIPPLFDAFRGHYWLNYIGVPLVYLSHLFIPLIFYDRSRIPYFWYFYMTFHFMSWGVGILFTGNFIMWFVFLPISRLFYKNYLEYSPDIACERRMAGFFKLLNWAGRMKFTPMPAAYPPRSHFAWETQPRTGFSAWRRMVWSAPLLWPLLPLIYLPGSNHIDRLMYRTPKPARPTATLPSASAAEQLQSVAALQGDSGNYLIYDGDCPFCTQYVRFLKLQQAVGPVTLLNARECPALVRDLNAHHMNINKGMVWSEGGTLYYDHLAINRLAILSEDDDAMNTLNRLLFANPRISKYLYAVLKFGRRMTLRILHRKPITLETR